MIWNWFLGDRNSIACNIGSHFVLRLLDKIMQFYSKTKSLTKETCFILKEKFHTMLSNIGLEKKLFFFFFLLKKYISEIIAYSHRLKQKYPSELYAPFSAISIWCMARKRNRSRYSSLSYARLEEYL